MLLWCALLWKIWNFEFSRCFELCKILSAKTDDDDDLLLTDFSFLQLPRKLSFTNFIHASWNDVPFIFIKEPSLKKGLLKKKKKIKIVIGRTFMATKIMQTTVKVYKITFSSPPQNLFFLSPLPNVISVKCTFFITCYGIMVARGGCRELIGENIII